MDKHFSLPGIQAIYYVPMSHLPFNIAYMRAAGIPIFFYAQKTKIPFVGQPTCETETTNEHKGKKQTVSLDFRSVVVIPEAYPIAFVVTDQNGQSFLIGQREEPYPRITCVQSFGNPEEDSNVLNVNVSYVQTNALVPIILGLLNA